MREEQPGAKGMDMRSFMGSVVVSVLLSSTILTCFAQTPAAPKYTAADIKEYISATEAELERRGNRERSLTEQIIMLDADIEGRVAAILTALSKHRDSTDSRGKLMGIKKDAIEGLQKSLEYYGRERDKRSHDLKANYSRVAKSDLVQDVDAINKRIDKRVEQIVDITKSFTEHKEFANYNRYNHHNGISGGKTPAQTRSDRSHKDGVREKSKLVEEMRDAMKKLERKNANLQGSLKWMTLANTKEAVQAELKRNNEVLAKRREQLIELIGSSKTATKTVSKDAAFEMGKLFDDVTDEIRKDFIKIKQYVIERDNARAALKPWKDRLANAKAALAKMEAAGATSK